MFAEWASNKDRMTPKAYELLLRRANELSKLYPGQYNGGNGYKRAIDSAFNEYQGASSAFSPPNRPRGIKSEGGGAAPTNFNFSKLSLDERIRAAAEDYANNVKEE